MAGTGTIRVWDRVYRNWSEMSSKWPSSRECQERVVRMWIGIQESPIKELQKAYLLREMDRE